MRGIKYFIFALVIVCPLHGDSKTFALATSSVQVLPEEELEALKVKFTKPVIEALLRFNGFHRKFAVPYLYVKNSLIYATEIAKATAYSPLFVNSDGVEEFALKHLLRMIMSSSPVYCTNVNCIASTIGDILAEIITKGGFVTTRVSDHVIRMYAGNLAGNILWRLSRLPDPDSHILESLKDAPLQLVKDYAQLVSLLAQRVSNSTLFHDFCRTRGFDSKTSEILSSAICGSRFLGFKLGLLGDLSNSMLESYKFAKTLLPENLEYNLASLVVSSIISEAITFSMIKQRYLKENENLDAVSHDVLKMILMGITNSKMDLRLANTFVKYSPKKVKRLSESAQQAIIGNISGVLLESDVFQDLFKTTQIPFQRLEAYASSMAKGVTYSLPDSSKEMLETISIRLTRTLISIAMSESGENSAKVFSDAISETLVELAIEMNLVDFNRDSISVSNALNQLIHNVLSFLEMHAEHNISPREKVTSSPTKLPIKDTKKSIKDSIFEKLSKVSNVFSSFWG
ncbi:uncharacterized protein TNIN_258441 [Trichonephila inaurata madagascariensis]|uniref:Uncharacterized protein n=1 Tax=Trichonephila inaurata madagascariensis TaxID=2747483 RepID=A0A8X6WYR8_9ARAC|nr:uncharacterized protein TNIN_258441 [Trichonephila inaurata madagascariensis]